MEENLERKRGKYKTKRKEAVLSELVFKNKYLDNELFLF